MEEKELSLEEYNKKHNTVLSLEEYGKKLADDELGKPKAQFRNYVNSAQQEVCECTCVVCSQ